jgi:regulator of replication initiation timing
MNIDDILVENKKLKVENIELKRQVDTYSKPQKSYYERNKEVVNQKAKERMKQLSQENPEKLKEINKKAYLKRKEKMAVSDI